MDQETTVDAATKIDYHIIIAYAVDFMWLPVKHCVSSALGNEIVRLIVGRRDMASARRTDIRLR